jgi:hypothetical protein
VAHDQQPAVIEPCGGQNDHILVGAGHGSPPRVRTIPGTDCPRGRSSRPEATWSRAKDGLPPGDKLGFDTVAIARGADKEELALRLGARRYLDSRAVDAVLREMGGARVILATATSNEAMSAVADGLGVDGKLLVVGATADPIEVTPLQLIGRRASVAGWLSGTAADSGDTMRFSVLAGVRAMVETLPLERGPEGYARMMRGEARFRVVLVPGGGGGDAGPSAGEPSAVRVGG